MNTEELKMVGREMMTSLMLFGVKFKTRSELRSVVVERLRFIEGHDCRAKRVIGDHVMSLFGYGGGL